MLRVLLASLLIAVPAAAAERTVAVGDFDRIRVDGPFDVELTTRANPAASISGDPRALDDVIVRVDGGTLIVRPGSSLRPTANVARAMVRLQTRDLRSAGVVGGARLRIAGPVAGQRIALSVTGTGEIAVPGLQADELAVTSIGDARLTLGGTARTARLLGNGGGEIAAAELVVNDVTVRTEGPIAVTVTARYTAVANSTGTGPIDIRGKPDCRVKAQAGGVIRCFNAPKN